ncbi:MAG TPA: PBP1A family penicillin-binding protein [Gemmatimonadaceae bacterium]|nr:PBP1A family penicillin-binding protein [Gemmatimonadaceae bacterium]
MTDSYTSGNRLARLRERLRPDPAVPARMWMRARWRSLLLLAVAVLGVGVFDVWLATCGFGGCPSAAQIRSFRPSEGSRVYDRAGRSLGQLTYVRRVNVPLSQVPLHVRQAFIAIEDRRFYQHNGLDWRAIPRAALRNVAALGIREGFSTITMQVARNGFTPRLVRHQRSLRKKLLELRLARLIEQNLSKDEILELYLNVIYLGNGTSGVEAASRDLFGTGVSRVSLAEGAVLAALPKGPSAYTPRRDPQRARARRDLVLASMVREGYVSQARAAAAAREPVRVAAEEWRPPQERSAALDAVRAVVDSVLGNGALERGDVRVYTTIDAAAQRAAERAVRNQAARIQRESEAWYGHNGSEVQGALVALDPRTGDIRAMVGSRRPEPRGFNRAVSAHRQPGSAFKPFVYAAALSAGYSPSSYVDDEPVEVRQAGQVWTPENYGGEYGGTVTLRRALMRSANAATVRVSRSIGEGRVVQVARRNGISSPLQAVPSIALGALEVTPLELVAAYAPFANGGSRVTPRVVRRIEDSDGAVLWSQEVAPLRPVMDPRDAYQLTSMLRGVVDFGTGHAVREWGADGPIAGKTGTTNNGADVWFVGYTPSLVAGVWFGYDTPRAITGDASGGRLAAPAWAEFYTRGWREPASSRTAWQPPDGMVARVIDSYTGELATEWCEVTQREWYKPGTEPTTYCRRHREPPPDEFDDGGIGDRLREAFRKIFRIE